MVGYCYGDDKMRALWWEWTLTRRKKRDGTEGTILEQQVNERIVVISAEHGRVSLIGYPGEFSIG